MKNYLTIDNSVHAVMVAFAFGSVANVYNYFAGAGHDVIASAAMAIALGTALATSAIMATKINMRKERFSFASVLGMVLVVGLVSGYIQTQGYIAHGVAATQAAIMGFGVPLAGEFLLALALAIYTGAIKRTKIHEADTALEVRVGESIAEVMQAVDVSSSAKYVEKKIATVIRHKADEMLSAYIPATDKDDTAKVEPTKPEVSRINGFTNEVGVNSRDAKRQERLALVNGLLVSNDYVTVAQCTDALSAAGHNEGIGNQTIRGYLTECGAETVGRGKWALVTPSWDQMELPTLPSHQPAQPILNGSH